MTCGVQSFTGTRRAAMSELPKKLGKRIAAERELLGWSQADLAERIGVTTETISRLERGVFDPSLARVASVANALEVPLHDLLRFGSDTRRDLAIQRFLSLTNSHAGRDVDMALRVVDAVLRSVTEKGPPRGN